MWASGGAGDGAGRAERAERAERPEGGLHRPGPRGGAGGERLAAWASVAAPHPRCVHSGRGCAIALRRRAPRSGVAPPRAAIAVPRPCRAPRSKAQQKDTALAKGKEPLAPQAARPRFRRPQGAQMSVPSWWFVLRRSGRLLVLAGLGGGGRRRSGGRIRDSDSPPAPAPCRSAQDPRAASARRRRSWAFVPIGAIGSRSIVRVGCCACACACRALLSLSSCSLWFGGWGARRRRSRGGGIGPGGFREASGVFFPIRVLGLGRRFAWVFGRRVGEAGVGS